MIFHVRRTQVAGVPQDEPPWQGEYQIPSRCMYYSMHCVTNVVWCCILFLVLARHGRRVCFFGGGRRHSFLFFRFLENLIYDISRPLIFLAMNIYLSMIYPAIFLVAGRQTLDIQVVSTMQS